MNKQDKRLAFVALVYNQVYTQPQDEAIVSANEWYLSTPNAEKIDNQLLLLEFKQFIGYEEEITHLTPKPARKVSMEEFHAYIGDKDIVIPWSKIKFFGVGPTFQSMTDYETRSGVFVGRVISYGAAVPKPTAYYLATDLTFIVKK